MADETWVSINGQWEQVHTQAVDTHAELDGRSDADAHPIASITGLDAALGGKSDTTHTHTEYYKVTVGPAGHTSPKVGDIWIPA